MVVVVCLTSSSLTADGAVCTGDHNKWAGEPLNEQCLQRNRGTHEVSKQGVCTML